MYSSVIILRRRCFWQHERFDSLCVSRRWKLLCISGSTSELWPRLKQPGAAAPEHSKTLCCLHAFGTFACTSDAAPLPTVRSLPLQHAPDATFRGNTLCSTATVWLLFPLPTFANSFSLFSSYLSLFLSLPPSLPLRLSLSPPSLCCISTRAARYSRGFPWQRSPDMQQVSVSRGTRFASSPLAHPAGFAGAPDWLARSSGLMVFTEMRS